MAALPAWSWSKLRDRRGTAMVLPFLSEPLTPEQIRKRWRLPEELANAPIPRRVNLSGKSWLLVFMGLVFLAVITPVGASMYGSIVQENRVIETLTLNGATANAKIVRKWTEPKLYNVSYSFLANGRTFTGINSLPLSIYGRISEGQQAPAVYLPSNPSVNRLAAKLELREPWTAWTALVFEAVPVLYALAVFFIVRRQWGLLRTGAATGAVVTSSLPERGGRLTAYRFLDQTGREHTGEATSKAAPEIGAIVTILYAPGHPRRNVLYPAPLVRLRA
jgi:hypothetical protein